MACPADENECRQLLSTAFEQDHPVAVRYPRGAGAGVALRSSGLDSLPFGKGEVRREGRGRRSRSWLSARCCIRHWRRPQAGCHRGQHALGQAAGYRTAAGRGGTARVPWSRWKKGAIMGGAGSAVLEALAAADVTVPVLQLGLRDAFIEHGDPVKLLALQGLDAAGIEASIRDRFARLLEETRPAFRVVN
jgi:1-deoxy-D-xylulose-5-phosphate synthase